MVLKIDDKINILKIDDKIMMGMLTNDVLTPSTSTWGKHSQNDDKKIVKNYLLSPSVVLLRFANDNVEFGEELKVFENINKV